MLNRKEMKENGKKAFKKAYWKCVGAGVLLSVALGGVYAAGGSQMKETGENLNNTLSSAPTGIVLAAVGVALVIALLAILIKEVIVAPLEVGCRSYFINNKNGEAHLGDCLSGYEKNFKNVFVTMLVRDVKISLWSLLLVVPGVVKTYEYKMVAYLLAQNPDMDRKEAFAMSKEMMNGHKMDAFKLDLSFIGWHILGALTLGLTELFYSTPYKAATDVEFFESTKLACA